MPLKFNHKEKHLLSTKKGTGLTKTYRLVPEDITPHGILPSSSILETTTTATSAWNNHNTNTNTNTNTNGILTQVSAALRSTFLPSGYPKSTPPGYLQYSIWSWIQDLSSQLRSVLATQRVLEGVGVGRQGATALSALLNFLVRDGCGMAANLLFTSYASSSFGTEGKRWRFFADIMVDIGLTLEVCATMVPATMFLPMICAGNMCKAICGVAAGAVNGVFHLHWARGSDIADITAKFGAQHTVTGSIGLLCAYQFVQLVAQVNRVHLWTLYGILTVLHLYANAHCMQIITFDYLNTPRLRLVVQQFLTQWENQQSIIPATTTATTTTSTANDDNSVDTLTLMNPKQMARKEPLLFFGTTPTSFGTKVPRLTFRNTRIRFGDSFEQHRKVSKLQDSKASSSALLGSITESLQESKYLISASSNDRRNKRIIVVVSLAADITPRQQVKAYLHAILLARALQEDTSLSFSFRQFELLATIQLQSAWPVFERACQASGWDLDQTQLSTMGYELSLVE